MAHWTYQETKQVNLTWSELLFLWEATEAVPHTAAAVYREPTREKLAAALWRHAAQCPVADRELIAKALESARVPQQEKRPRPPQDALHGEYCECDTCLPEYADTPGGGP